MKKKEAKRLREISDELEYHCNKLFFKDPRNDTNYTQARWFYWAATEIRKVLFDSGYPSFNDTSTTKTHRFSEED